MQIFTVVGALDAESRSSIVEKARQQYSPPYVYTAGEGIFIATEIDTTEEVSRKLGMSSDTNRNVGVVVRVQHYWGYHEGELWEWLSARGNGNGFS